MFNNYYLAQGGCLIDSKMNIGLISGFNDVMEIDVVFMHYNYATAMYHY